MELELVYPSIVLIITLIQQQTSVGIYAFEQSDPIGPLPSLCEPNMLYQVLS